MKVSPLFIVVAILSCFLHEISAYGDCVATCPTGCQVEKDCNFIACICTCNCNPTQNPPSTTQPPPVSNPTPPSTTQPPPINGTIQCCVNAGVNALACIPQYLEAVLLNPTLQFSSGCCQNLKDLQTYCVNGFVPSEVANVDFLQFDYNYHCSGN